MNLLKTPLWNRKRILEQILKPKKGIIEIADCAKGKTTEDMRAYLERILEERSVAFLPLSPFVEVLTRYDIAGEKALSSSILSRCTRSAVARKRG